ncbi:MAG: helix-turn-helix domain-containing protein [Spirochaetia bacterium]|nr:helix-turn-helix domain-containing protein [Spirochaetia bacterium]
MDSLGVIFSQARDKKGYTLEQVSAETHISKEYIQAVELEHFDEFPGDAYCVGFLNNLSRYYGLDNSEIIKIYKSIRFRDLEQYKQQKADTGNPVAVKKTGKYRKLTIPVLLIVFVAVLIWTLIPLFSSSRSENVESKAENKPLVTEETVQIAEPEQSYENIPSPESVSEAIDRMVLFSSPVKKHFAVNIEFSGYCFFRYKIDNAERVEKYFQKGDHLRLEAYNEVRVWMSNAGALKGVVSGHEIFFGDRGVVSSDRIQWEKSADGKFNMVVVAMD